MPSTFEAEAISEMEDDYVESIKKKTGWGEARRPAAVQLFKKKKNPHIIAMKLVDALTPKPTAKASGDGAVHSV